MADVKLKDGYIKVVNNLFNQLFLREFTLKQIRVILLIIRFSYGCQKKCAIIKPKCRFEFANLHRSDVDRELKKLIEKRIINKIADYTYSLNKNYDNWLVPYHRYYNKKSFKTLLNLQLATSEMLVNYQQKDKEDRQSTNTNVGELPTNNDEMLSNHQQEQPENQDIENNTNPSKNIFKDSFKNILKDKVVSHASNASKNFDPYFNNPTFEYIKAEWKKVFNTTARATAPVLRKVMELEVQVEDFKNTIPKVLKDFKKLDLKYINHSVYWLFSDDNYVKILDGHFKNSENSDSKKEEQEYNAYL